MYQSHWIYSHCPILVLVQSTTNPIPLPHLGTRPVNYQPDPTDYIWYEKRRDEFLRGPRGRAALMDGRIAWRFARSVLGDDVVMTGPTVFNSQSRIFKSDDGCEYYDDSLLQDEEYLICGGYCVKLGRGDQTADMSWWPKPSVWASCGFNFGFWLSACEDWFQHRLMEIHSGKARLRTSKEWKNTLAQYRNTIIFMINTEKLSADFFSGARYF